MNNKQTFKPMWSKKKEKQLELYKEDIAKYKGKKEFQSIFDNFFEYGSKGKKIGQSYDSTVYKVWISKGLLERDIYRKWGF